MKKIVLFFLLLSTFVFSQMPDISPVWMNNSQPYIGTIGDKKTEIKVRITVSEQNKKNDQEYFLLGYSVVDNNYAKFEGKLKILKYKDSKKRGTVYGEYELSEEPKGKHSGTFRGKFVFNFKWNPKTEKIESPYIQFTGNWVSYDKTLDYKTDWKTDN